MKFVTRQEETNLKNLFLVVCVALGLILSACGRPDTTQAVPSPAPSPLVIGVNPNPLPPQTTGCINSSCDFFGCYCLDGQSNEGN